MDKVIDKINRLKKMQGFLQLNYSKGFKYIDKAGEFMNNIYEDNILSYTMDPRGLTVYINEKQQLKVDSNNLWMSFIEPEDFESQTKAFISKADFVRDIFSPEKFTRIGWRMYFVYNCEKALSEIITYDFSEKERLEDITISRKIQDFKCRINVSNVKNKDTQKKALMFDVDIFNEKISINNSDFQKVVEDLNQIKDIYKSDALLKTINNFIR